MLRFDVTGEYATKCGDLVFLRVQILIVNINDFPNAVELAECYNGDDNGSIFTTVMLMWIAQ